MIREKHTRASKIPEKVWPLIWWWIHRKWSPYSYGLSTLLNVRYSYNDEKQSKEKAKVSI